MWVKRGQSVNLAKVLAQQGWAKAVAKPGDFREQDDFGGTFVVQTPTSSMLKTAQQILTQLESPILYARVDGVLIEG